MQGTIELDIEEGTLTLTDEESGRSANYHRVDGAFKLTVLHAIWDATGGFAKDALLDADTFPEELFIKHEAPPAQKGEDFRYVLDKK